MFPVPPFITLSTSDCQQTPPCAPTDSASNPIPASLCLYYTLYWRVTMCVSVVSPCRTADGSGLDYVDSMNEWDWCYESSGVAAHTSPGRVGWVTRNTKPVQCKAARVRRHAHTVLTGGQGQNFAKLTYRHICKSTYDTYRMCAACNVTIVSFPPPVRFGSGHSQISENRACLTATPIGTTQLLSLIGDTLSRAYRL